MKTPYLPAESTRRSSCLQRLAGCAALVLSTSAYAVCTPTPTVACLADQPIQSANVIKPNLMFLLDNSGSMAWDYMPDSASYTDARRRNHLNNTIYYNPDVNYSAILPSKPNATTGAIEIFPSQSFTNAQCDPYRNVAGQGGCDPYGSTTVNLSTSFKAYDGDTAQAAYYCKYVGGATSGASPCNRAGFQKVVITDAAEKINFANWFSYNRTRQLMMKTGMAAAFAPLDDKYRIGFHTINNPTSTGSSGGSMAIQDFSGGATGTPKGTWYSTLFRQESASGTPLQEALVRVGQYYSGNGASGLSGDPIQYSCQKNFTIMSSDGGWNGNNPNKGNWDKTIPATMPIREGNSTYNPTDTGLTAGAQFPMPYYEGTTANHDTLADIAMYYWVRDLRTSGPQAANNVPTPPSDPAYWQHMNLFTIGLGVTGNLTPPSASSLGDFCALQDPAHLPSSCIGYTGPWKSWPTNTPSGGDSTTTGTIGMTKFDDLWHAAINGRGQYYSAHDPQSLATGLASALKAVVDVPAYGVGPSSSTSDFKSPGQNDYTTYVTSYRVINWSGDIKKFAIDRATGMKTGSALWSAAKQLDSKVNPGLTSTVDATAYTSRNIVSRNDLSGKAVKFEYTTAPNDDTLTAAQLTALCYKAPPGTGSCVTNDPSLINYLRGEAAYEGVYGVGSSRFRDRHDATENAYFKRDLLGSIINAQPAYVGAEQGIVQDTGYAAFKAARKTRSPTLYAGANDGMLHAFDAATGNELWAYVPSFIIPTGTDENGKEKGMRAISYQDSGAPPFNHHYYLDGPLVTGPVDFNRTGGTVPLVSTEPTLSSGLWKTLLVGGLGKGGKGYFALDVTEPATSLADAKTKVLWEFPSASDPTHATVISDGLMGYSYGMPIIAKTHSYGWVVMLPSGFNNTDKYGYVFVLNAKTGALLETLKTPTQAPGMAHITVLGNARNMFAKQVYAGDLSGNIWRFDFGSMPLAPRVAQLFSSSSNTPITSKVTVAIDGNNGDRWIFFGTGQYLDVPDRSVSAGYKQYIGAVRDGSISSPKTTGLPVTLSSMSTLTDLMVGVPSAPLGWKYELTETGERNILAPDADLRTVLFATLTPTTDPCSPGSSGNAYALDYATGKTRMLVGTTLTPYFHSNFTISSIGLVQTGQGVGTAGSPKGIICTSDGNCFSIKPNQAGIYSGTRHIGWRELLNDYY